MKECVDVAQEYWPKAFETIGTRELMLRKNLFRSQEQAVVLAALDSEKAQDRFPGKEFANVASAIRRIASEGARKSAGLNESGGGWQAQAKANRIHADGPFEFYLRYYHALWFGKARERESYRPMILTHGENGLSAEGLDRATAKQLILGAFESGSLFDAFIDSARRSTCPLAQ